MERLNLRFISESCAIAGLASLSSQEPGVAVILRQLTGIDLDLTSGFLFKWLTVQSIYLLKSPEFRTDAYVKPFVNVLVWFDLMIMTTTTTTTMMMMIMMMITITITSAVGAE